jgi:hypothetical protein
LIFAVVLIILFWYCELQVFVFFHIYIYIPFKSKIGNLLLYWKFF